jgi:AAA15 family ATPase/GTPase
MLKFVNKFQIIKEFLMVLEFKVENFRSFNTQQVFSFVAESTKSKPNNVFEAPLPKGTSVRLLKSAVIYGANASGKSNFLKAFQALRFLITQSDGFKIDREINCYEPFLLDKTSRYKPTKFEITFIVKGEENVKYHYIVEYNGNEITSESLHYFPKGEKRNLYERKYLDGDYHEIKIEEKEKAGVPKKFLKNQLILSKFGSEPHEKLNAVYRFFDNMSIGNTLDKSNISALVDKLGEEISKPENEILAQQLTLLIKAADTQIQSIFTGDMSDKLIRKIKDLPFSDKIKDKILENNQLRIIGKHNIYENGKIVDEEDFDFRDNISLGTNAMFAIGGIILKKLSKGGLVVFDELDNSLHPKISRFFIQLFHKLNVNTGNAQIVFSTHEPLLMDKDMFRSDQIWFTEKNKFGETELYSAQDFEGVREDIPFDKWYMAGKFGALPNIQESIFSL